MRTPTDLEREQLIHLYDPAKAHEYYLRVRKLKGRKHGSSQPPSRREARQQHNSVKTKQKQELQARITGLSKKLNELEKLIQTKEEALKRSKATANANTKGKGDKKTAADKAKAARENKKYRKKHKQELKTKAKQASNKSGGGSSSKKTAANPRKASISELKNLATKVRGQLAVAKQKLAAL